MKRLAAVMMMALLVAACGDSTTSVKPGNNPPGDDIGLVPPDTVMRSEGISAEFYGREHPVTLARSADLAAREDAAVAVARLESAGYSRDASGPVSLNFTLPDGRVAELTTWHFPGVGAGAGFGELVHFKLDGREILRPLRVSPTGDGRADVAVMENATKIGADPGEVWWLYWLTCIVQFLADLSSCISSCTEYSWPCIKACYLKGSMSLATCIWMISL